MLGESGPETIQVDSPTRRLSADLAAVLRSMIHQRDPYTVGHMSGVESLANRIGKKLGLAENVLEGLLLGARLHDVGKYSIPLDILNKPGRLSSVELELLREHSERGYAIVSPLAWSRPIPEMLLQHHERLDGSGYPFGIKGKDILLEARIIAVADVAEAMLSHRPYRPALSLSVVEETIHEGRGQLWDAEVVDACLRVFHEGDLQFPLVPVDLSQTADRS